MTSNDQALVESTSSGHTLDTEGFRVQNWYWNATSATLFVTTTIDLGGRCEDLRVDEAGRRPGILARREALSLGARSGGAHAAVHRHGPAHAHRPGSHAVV